PDGLGSCGTRTKPTCGVEIWLRPGTRLQRGLPQPCRCGLTSGTLLWALAAHEVASGGYKVRTTVVKTAVVLATAGALALTGCSSSGGSGNGGSKSSSSNSARGGLRGRTS